MEFSLYGSDTNVTSDGTVFKKCCFFNLHFLISTTEDLKAVVVNNHTPIRFKWYSRKAINFMHSDCAVV
jgi:hypothetical protein